MSERQLWYVTKVILVWGCVPFVVYGQQKPKAAAPRGLSSGLPALATWTGNGDDGGWANGNNWQWTNDDNECTPNGFAIPPGTASAGDPTSPCYFADVNIPPNSGTISTQNVSWSSYIDNFTLNIFNTLNGGVRASGNALIAGGATVNGGVGAGQGTATYMQLAGTLTNQGTISLGSGGGASGCTIVNTGVIKGSGSIFTPYNTTECGASADATTGTNAGTIEATSATLQLAGIWDNTKGTIKIDGNAELLAGGTITGGAIIDNGGMIGGGVVLAGQVSSTSLTVDGNGAVAEVSIDGTLTNSGALTIGLTAGPVSTVQVNDGGTLTTGNTILGVTARSTGQLLIEAGGTCTPAGTLTIGDNGSGVLSVSGSLQAQAIILGNMAGGSGQMNIMPNGTVTYTGHLSAGGTLVSAGGIVSNEGTATITIDGGGALTGKGAGTPPDVIAGTANVTVNGAWTNVNGILTAGTVTVSAGGALNVNCPACYIPSSGLSAFSLVAGTVFVFGNVDGSGTLTTTGGLLVSGQSTKLTVTGGGS
jgi:hypothetical protein